MRKGHCHQSQRARVVGDEAALATIIRLLTHIRWVPPQWARVIGERRILFERCDKCGFPMNYYVSAVILKAENMADKVEWMNKIRNVIQPSKGAPAPNKGAAPAKGAPSINSAKSF
ncbi:hypothetical protein QJS10_CPA03g01286 [Acorus calamus]|uniref:PH domain-containing protein n=1 Tax=Acorus calamus TaxID=4465 RepID=A0AAV9F967_ACOCL|nr:hypothetical protein QJS10_CPA03g01286 [Acorus calamus]